MRIEGPGWNRGFRNWRVNFHQTYASNGPGDAEVKGAGQAPDGLYRWSWSAFPLKNGDADHAYECNEISRGKRIVGHGAVHGRHAAIDESRGFPQSHQA